MLCKINDTVIYGSEGVCRITGISKKTLSGVENEYYVLKPVNDENSTIYAPLNSEKTKSKIRRILSAEEIVALIKEIPNEDTIWIENDHERRTHYKEILTRGDRTELIQLIKTLYTHQQSQKEKNRKLQIADERLMQDAERMLHGEFSHVLKLSKNQVIEFIAEHLQTDEDGQATT